MKKFQIPTLFLSLELENPACDPDPKNSKLYVHPRLGLVNVLVRPLLFMK